MSFIININPRLFCTCRLINEILIFICDILEAVRSVAATNAFFIRSDPLIHLHKFLFAFFFGALKKLIIERGSPAKNKHCFCSKINFFFISAVSQSEKELMC
jgi:hypothetical protein